MNNLIGQSITVKNDRGALYRGTLLAVVPNGDIMMEVEGICLTGRGCDGNWYTYKKVEVQTITGPTLETTND